MKRLAGARPIASFFFVLFVCALLAAPQTTADDYVGTARCGACHPEKLKTQSASEHAHALSRPSEHSLANDFVQGKTFVRSGKYSFQFLRDLQGFHVHAFDSRREIDIPLEWAFGAGAQAVTFASQVNSEWYLEHALSYYSTAHSYFTTPGQPAPRQDTLPAALGVLYRSEGDTEDIRHCFECHSTGKVALSPTGHLQPSESGVRCEACHGAGRPHTEAAGRGDLIEARNAIQNPARLSASDLNIFCGRCHRQPAAPATETDWAVAWNVRHQPVYLNQSQCFRQSSGALSCLTCHNPHSSLEKSRAAYNSKCIGCHRQAAHKVSSLDVATSARDCVGCHMPQVSPQAWLRFTNHWIGIYTAGNKLMPLRRDR